MPPFRLAQLKASENKEAHDACSTTITNLIESNQDACVIELDRIAAGSLLLDIRTELSRCCVKFWPVNDYRMLAE